MPGATPSQWFSPRGSGGVLKRRRTVSDAHHGRDLVVELASQATAPAGVRTASTESRSGVTGGGTRDFGLSAKFAISARMGCWPAQYL